MIFAEFLSLSYHFESISRGVLDLRDILYYLTVIGLFLFFNQTTLAWRKRR